MIKFYEEFIMNENIKKLNIRTFRELYNLCPLDLQTRIFNLKLIPQGKKWHPEGNVLKHTILVVTRAIKENDIDIILAALFHDIGKDKTFAFKNNIPTAYGHEVISSDVIDSYKTFIESLGGNIRDIKYIVSNHMKMKIFRDMRKTKQEALTTDAIFHKLERFATYIDKGGFDI